jgi:hypothetical protein
MKVTLPDVIDYFNKERQHNTECKVKPTYIRKGAVFLLTKDLINECKETVSIFSYSTNKSTKAIQVAFERATEATKKVSLIAFSLLLMVAGFIESGIRFAIAGTLHLFQKPTNNFDVESSEFKDSAGESFTSALRAFPEMIKACIKN